MASANKNKIVEASAILGWALESLADIGYSDEIIEDGQTFADNALIKARTVHKTTGFCAIADDSGICVDYLGGEPGVYSARFAGIHGDDDANNKLLLSKLENVVGDGRKASYVCAAACVFPDGEEFVALGELKGHLLDGPMGEGGFGYDPLFVPQGCTESFGQMDQEKKNQISHRMLAFTQLKELMDIYFKGQGAKWLQ